MNDEKITELKQELSDEAKLEVFEKISDGIAKIMNLLPHLVKDNKDENL